MDRTNKERILDYLWTISHEQATNSQIRDGTDIKSHQQVYLLIQELMRAGMIRGEQRGLMDDVLIGRCGQTWLDRA